MSEQMGLERLSGLAALMLLLSTAFAKSPLTVGSTATLLLIGLMLVAPYCERGTLAAGVAAMVGMLFVAAIRFTGPV